MMNKVVLIGAALCVAACGKGDGAVDESGQIRPAGSAELGAVVLELAENETISGLVYGVDGSYLALRSSATGSEAVLGNVDGTAVRPVCPSFGLQPGAPPIIIGGVGTEPGAVCEGVNFPNSLPVQPVTGNTAAMKVVGNDLIVIQGFTHTRCNLETLEETQTSHSGGSIHWVSDAGLESFDVQTVGTLYRFSHNIVGWDGVETLGPLVEVDAATSIIEPVARLSDEEMLVGNNIYNLKTDTVTELVPIQNPTSARVEQHHGAVELRTSDAMYVRGPGATALTPVEFSTFFYNGGGGFPSADGASYVTLKGGVTGFDTGEAYRVDPDASGATLNPFRRLAKMGEGPILSLSDAIEAEQLGLGEGETYSVDVPKGSDLPLPGLYEPATMGLNGTCFHQARRDASRGSTGQTEGPGPWGVISYDCNNGADNGFQALAYNVSTLVFGEVEHKWRAAGAGEVYEGSALLVIGDQATPTCGPVDTDTFSLYRLDKGKAIPIAQGARKHWVRGSDLTEPFLIQTAEGLRLTK